MNNYLQCADKRLSLDTPQVMGILNVTPDSFSDGGKFNSYDNALLQAQQMISDGATIIDIGGESTRPGAPEVAAEQECERVIPVLKALKERFDIVVSVDTSKALVMKEAIEQGAGIINDVRALQNDGALTVAASCDLPICLMHMQGLPRTMQQNPQYSDVVEDIMRFFNERIAVCEHAGIAKERLIVDPGFGFGKTLEQNYQLLAHLHQFDNLGLPVLSGTSRKSMIGNLLDRTVDERLAGSLTTAIIAAQQGAKIIRVHDVKETVDAICILEAAKQLN